MSYTIQFHPEQRLFYIRLYDRVTRDVIIRVLDQLLAEPAWAEGADVIWNGLDISEFLLESNDFEGIRQHFRYRETHGKGKGAMVVHRAVHVTVAHFFRVLMKIPGREIRVFSTMREAEEWIEDGKVET